MYYKALEFISMKTKPSRCAIFLFSFQSTFESNQDYPTLRFGWTFGEGLDILSQFDNIIP